MNRSDAATFEFCCLHFFLNHAKLDPAAGFSRGTVLSRYASRVRVYIAEFWKNDYDYSLPWQTWRLSQMPLLHYSMSKVSPLNSMCVQSDHRTLGGCSSRSSTFWQRCKWRVCMEASRSLTAAESRGLIINSSCKAPHVGGMTAFSRTDHHLCLLIYKLVFPVQ